MPMTFPQLEEYFQRPSRAIQQQDLLGIKRGCSNVGYEQIPISQGERFCRGNVAPGAGPGPDMGLALVGDFWGQGDGQLKCLPTTSWFGGQTNGEITHLASLLPQHAG